MGEAVEDVEETGVGCMACGGRSHSLSSRVNMCPECGLRDTLVYSTNPKPSSYTPSWSWLWGVVTAEDGDETY